MPYDFCVTIIMILTNIVTWLKFAFCSEDDNNSYNSRPGIKPWQIANCDKFPDICGEDCDPFRVICGKYFSFNECFFIYFLITTN